MHSPFRRGGGRTAEDLLNVCFKLNVMCELLHQDVIERQNFAVSDKYVGLKEDEARKDLAVILYPLVEDISHFVIWNDS